MKKKKIILIAVSLAILAGGGVWLFGGSTAKHKVTYATATRKQRRDIGVGNRHQELSNR